MSCTCENCGIKDELGRIADALEKLSGVIPSDLTDEVLNRRVFFSPHGYGTVVGYDDNRWQVDFDGRPSDEPIWVKTGLCSCGACEEKRERYGPDGIIEDNPVRIKGGVHVHKPATYRLVRFGHGEAMVRRFYRDHEARTTDADSHGEAI